MSLKVDTIHKDLPINWCPITSFPQSVPCEGLNNDTLARYLGQFHSDKSLVETTALHNRVELWYRDRNELLRRIEGETNRATFHIILEDLEVKMGQFRELNFIPQNDKEFPNDRYLAQLMGLPELIYQAKGNLKGINRELISELLANPKWVQTLDLKQVNQTLTDENLKELLEAFPFIKRLNISYAAHLTPKSLKYISNLSHLKQLYAGRCPALLKASDNDRLPSSLKVLELSGLKTAPNDMASWLANLTQLKTLDISENGQMVLPEVEALFFTFPELTHCNLTGVLNFADFTQLQAANPHLTLLGMPRQLPARRRALVL